MTKKAEKILNTIIKLFIQGGIKKTTMDEIAEQAKVSKVTIYKYFSDKDTLYYEVGKNILSLHVSKLNEIIESEDPLVKRLYSFLAIVSEFTDTGHFALCRELAQYNDNLSCEYENYISIYTQTLLHLIDEGIEKGLIKPTLDRQFVFHYINIGVVYYQQNLEYRNEMRSDTTFRKEFMIFQISNIFVDVEKVFTTIA